MILIIGGAFQGKRNYAMEKYALSPEQVYTCKEASIDFSKPCIDDLEEFTFACIQQEMDPKEFFLANRECWKNSILICDDIFCGVVPLEQENRRWRQTTGRLCQYLAAEAGRVVRIFCGLEQMLK